MGLMIGSGHEKELSDSKCNNPDTIKLPHLLKPKWMRAVESDLHNATPPFVGAQVTRLMLAGKWESESLIPNKDELSSLYSGDTVYPGSPNWEAAPSNRQKKEWGKSEKQS